MVDSTFVSCAPFRHDVIVRRSFPSDVGTYGETEGADTGHFRAFDLIGWQRVDSPEALGPDATPDFVAIHLQTHADIAAAAPWLLSRPTVVVLVASGQVPQPTAHGLLQAGLAELIRSGYCDRGRQGYVGFAVREDVKNDYPEVLFEPAGPADHFVDEAIIDRDELIANLQSDVIEWRARAVRGWADSLAGLDAAAGSREEHYRQELEAMRQTISWRITEPLRRIRRSKGQ